MKNVLHIAYSLDDNYVDLCKLSMYSIIAHKNKDTEIYFYIVVITGFISDLTVFDKFKELEDVHVQVIVLGKEIADRIKNIAQVQHQWDNFYPRFLIPNLPTFYNVDRVLHLDADTLILKDLTELYNIDMGNNLVGMTFNQNHLFHGDMCRRNFCLFDLLFNGGTFLLNCKEIRKGGYVEKWLNMFETMVGQNLYDETLFTQHFYDQTKQLPPTANVLYPLILDDYPYVSNIFYWNVLHNTSYKSFTELLEQTYILHMFGDKDNIKTLPVLNYAYTHLKQKLDIFFDIGIFDTDVKDIDKKLIWRSV